MKKLFLSVFLFILYGSVGYFSEGFDDEFFTIRLIEKLGLGIVPFLQTTDIHPPGSYFFDAFLFSVFGKWELVRLIISFITAASLIYAILSIKKRNGKFAGFIAFILLGLNPAILLWCTSIRWYAFFIPVLIWLSIIPKKNDWKYWAKCFGGLLLIGYFGYAAILVFIPVLWMYWKESTEEISKKVNRIFIFGGLSFLLYSYQLFIFFTVHFKNKDSQISSLLKSAYGIFSSQISNQGVFPISIPGIITSLSTIGIICVIFYSAFKSNTQNKYFISYTLTTLSAIITGVASKIRNLVIISPWQALWISTSTILAQHKKVFVFFLACLTVGNLWGDLHIITHHNTTKSNFNLPIKIILDEMQKEKVNSKNDLIILCHDPKLTWHLNHEGYSVIGPYSHTILTQKLFQSKHSCVVVLKTFTGVQSDFSIKMYDELKLLKYKTSSTKHFGLDDFYEYKDKINPQYPEYMIEATTFYEVEKLDTLKLWMPVKSELLGN
jgi:hypothetical protein